MPLEMDSEKLRQAFDKVPRLLNVSVKEGLRKIGMDFENAMQERFRGQLSGPWKRNRGDTLANRQGSLRRSIRTPVTGSTLSNMRLRATVGDAISAPYARIQEEGGTVRPKKAGGFLTVPMPDNLTPTGRTKTQRPRSDPSIFVTRVKGNAYLVRKSAGGEGLEFLFLLKKQVKIKPRLGFKETWFSEGNAKSIQTTLQRRVDKTLKVAGLL